MCSIIYSNKIQLCYSTIRSGRLPKAGKEMVQGVTVRIETTCTSGTAYQWIHRLKENQQRYNYVTSTRCKLVMGDTIQKYRYHRYDIFKRKYRYH